MNKKSARIIADEQIPFVKEFFSVLGTVCPYDGRKITAAVIADADVLLVRSTTAVNEALLKNSPVRFVGSATSGVDHVDLSFLGEQDIQFAHAPGSNARAVAEYVLSCLYVLDLAGLISPTKITVGIIGCGYVGSMLRRLLGVLGIPCVVNDPPLQEQTQAQQYCTLAELAQADVISLHVPLTRTGQYPTYHMIAADFLDQCKPDAVLINTARGAVIDQQALLTHMKKKSQFTMICDTWEHEPHINRELLAKGKLTTPHIAGYSFDGKITATKMLYHAAVASLGGPIKDKPHSFTAVDADVIQIDGTDAIRSAVLSSYDVRVDSAALKRMLRLPAAQSGTYFDSLRRDYPKRRDFTARTISLRAQDIAQMQQLKDLGFNIRR